MDRGVIFSSTAQLKANRYGGQRACVEVAHHDQGKLLNLCHWLSEPAATDDVPLVWPAAVDLEHEEGGGVGKEEEAQDLARTASSPEG